jgi:ketosteroid isomerase-like protein
MTRPLPSPFALGGFLALALMAAPGLAAQQDAAAGIAAGNAALSAAIAAGDADAAVAVYLENASFMGANAPAAVGHDAIRAAFQGMIEAGIGRVALTTDEIEAFGDTAYEVGRYVLDAKDGTHLDHGKYVVIWKRAGDGWKMYRDIFNSDMPAPGGH